MRPEGAIAQLGERLLCKQEVVGSIPSGSTNTRAYLLKFARTFRCGTAPGASMRRPLRAIERACHKSQVLRELVSSRCIFYIVKRGLT